MAGNPHLKNSSGELKNLIELKYAKKMQADLQQKSDDLTSKCKAVCTDGFMKEYNSSTELHNCLEECESSNSISSNL